MAINLGTIIVELQARTGAFTKGMSDAKEYTFTSVEGITGSLAKIGTALGKLKFDNAKQITRSLEIMGGVAGGVAVAAGAALAEMTHKGIETAAKFELMSQATGVSTEALSGLGFAAKQSGVDQETLNGGLERLARNALQSAAGNERSALAFRMLGINVKDANGQLKPADQLFLEISDRFSKMQDGTAKTALAIRIFGNAGAALIPMLNEGRGGLEEFIKQAERLGLIVGTNTAEAAHKFEQSMNLLGAAVQGTSNQLATRFLPVLQQIADNIISSSQEGQGRFQDFLGALVVGTKAFLTAFGAIQTFFDDLGNFIKAFGAQTILVFEGLGAAAKALWDRDWNGLRRVATETLDSIHNQTVTRNAQSKQIWDEYLSGVAELWAKKMPTGQTPHNKRNQPPPTVGDQRPNTLAETVAKLKQQTEAEIALAEAQLQGEQAVRATTAAGQAEKIITELAIRYANQHKVSLDAARQAVEQKAGADVRAYVALDQNAKLNASFNKTLADGIRDQGVAADAQARLAAAANQGGEAIREATIQNQLDAIVRKTGIQLTDAQKQKLNELAEAYRRVQAAEITTEFADQVISLQRANQYTQQLTAAIIRGNDAQIQAEAHQQAVNFALQHNIGLDDTRLKQLEDLYAQQLRLNQVQQTASDLINNYDPSRRYQETLDRINAAIKAGVITGREDLAVTAARRAALEQLVQAQEQIAGLSNTGAMAGIRTALASITVQYGNLTTAAQGATKTIVQGVGSGIRGLVSDLFRGTKSIGQAFTDMAATMVGSFIDALAQMVEQFIVTQVILKALNKIFGTDFGGSQAEAAARSNSAQATSAAFLGAANAYAYNAWNPPLAAAMSALALGVGLGFAGASLAAGLSVKSGAGGYDIPQDMLMQVHKDEVVLPAHLSRGFKSIIGGLSPGGSSAQGARRGGDIHFTDNSNYSAINSRGMAEVLRRHRAELVATLKDAWRNGELRMNPA